MYIAPSLKCIIFADLDKEDPLIVLYNILLF